MILSTGSLITIESVEADQEVSIAELYLCICQLLEKPIDANIAAY